MTRWSNWLLLSLPFKKKRTSGSALMLTASLKEGHQDITPAMRLLSFQYHYPKKSLTHAIRLPHREIILYKKPVS